jgi:ABC-type transport system substrate-binding protein
VIATAGVAGAAAILAACGSDDDSGGDDAEQEKAELGSYSPSAGTVQSGGRYSFAGSTTANFNVVANFNEGTALSGAYVYDRPLTSREDSRRYVLEALESIETPDPLTVVMKLKPATYHEFAPVNGRAVRASDVVATQEYVRNEPAAFNKTFQRDFLDKAEAPDDRTIIYRLKKPSAYLFSQNFLGNGNGQPIIPAETIDGLNVNKQVGSGPFYVDSAQLSVNYFYKKNPKYHGADKGLPHVAEIEVKFIPDSAAEEAAFRSGQIDRFSRPTPTQVESLPKELGERVRLFELAGFRDFSWQLNMSKPFPWQKDVRVREALWRLTNRQQIIDLGLQGRAIAPVGLLAAGLKLYQLEQKDIESYYKEDIEKSKQLLAAANFDLNREWEIFTQFPGTFQEQSSLVFQQQLLKVGMKTKIATVAGSAQLFQRWTDNDWELQVQTGSGADTPAQSLRLQHSKSWSDTYKNFALMDPEIDALIEKSETIVDPAENIALVKQAQMECIKKFTSSYQLATPNEYFLLQARVQNWELTLVIPVSRSDMWLKQS